MSRWYRAYEGTCNDAKLAEAAMIADVSRAVSIAAWHCLLESCTAVNNCGTYATNPRRVSLILCEPTAAVEALFAAYEELNLIEAGSVVSWKKRQFQQGADPNPETHVYIAGSDWSKTVKIGFSKNPWARVKELQTGNANKVEVLAHFKCSATSERELHEVLAKQRHAGEWFNLSPDVTEIIRTASKAGKTYEDLLRALRSATSLIKAETEAQSETDDSSSDDDSPSGDEPSLRPEHVFEFYQETARALGLTIPRDLTPERRRLTRARIAQYSLEDFQTVFAKCRDSPFLRGDKGRTPLNYDWVMKKANFQKVLEGNYDR